MKNKIELKKMCISSFIITVIFLGLNIFIVHKEYETYTKNFNNKISTIFSEVLKKYPDVKKEDLIKILNETSNGNNKLFREYGINLEKDSAILANDIKFKKFIVLDICIIILFIVALTLIFFRYNSSQGKKINEITRYIEEINKKNYKLDIEDNSEDELSILKNELYKVTVMLKELAENSQNDKLKLKDSLSDISHQLKTPITSIIIMLDNILDDKEMSENIRNEFIKDIKREIINIKFLVESILKLSKIDSNTVKFIKKEVNIKELITEALKNISMMRDIKNIKINVKGNDVDAITCDIKWQIEAITNILKNCIEHSKENGEITIEYGKNNIYTEIKIIDYGTGIEKQDLPHIFERFYKGKNSSNDSIGIGLALSKSIIESNNGYIEAESVLGKGTIFTIKYFL